jgi:DNA-directed RNA polymerase specialized sigma24 family protein
MRYIVNPAGNRIVVATPTETHALRPSIAASFRSRYVSEGDIEDFCQEVEIVAWQAVQEQRIVSNDFVRPVDALLSFMFAIAWNLWRNHRRKRWVWNEAVVDEMPDVAGPDPDGRIDARETLLRLMMREDIARILIDAASDVPFAERVGDLPRTTYFSRLTNARKWAKEVDAGRWRGPKQPTPSTPWKRKKKR